MTSRHPANLRIVSLLFLFVLQCFAQTNFITTDKEQRRSDGCTTVTVGRLASFDGSVMTSHTMDGHRDRTWVNIIPPKRHKKGVMRTLHKRLPDDTKVMPLNKFVPAGEIPEIEYTHGYINTILRCMNDQQLAMGESTFGGRSSLHSENGLIQYEEVSALVLERCSTAREAIQFMADITKEYGWADRGECYTFADPKEVWHFEIVGPGKGKKGSIWAAQRVPDDHVSVNANGSRIHQIDLSKPDYFMASENLTQTAQDSGWWKPEDGPFEFCYAYDPGSRQSFSTRRREWRALSLLAPSLDLHPNSENYPFSVKPDSAVTLEKVMQIFKDYYEGTDFNPVKNITWENKDGKSEISPLANPFMPYDMLPLYKVNGGWGKLGERTIARWYTTYGTIIQCRGWLPAEIGGVVWLAWDNIATAVYTPLYCSISDVPESFKICGRETGYSRESAWWAFNRLSTLTAQRWGDMRHDVDAVWQPMQAELFASQREIDDKAHKLYRDGPQKAKEFLTKYSLKHADEAVQKAWKLGDFLWNKYDEKF